MPYPLDGEESESSEPTTERELPGVSMTEGLRRMQAEINRISHAALEVESPRIRTSDMAQEVAEIAHNLSLLVVRNGLQTLSVDSNYVRDTQAMSELMEGLLVFPRPLPLDIELAAWPPKRDWDVGKDGALRDRGFFGNDDSAIEEVEAVDLRASLDCLRLEPGGRTDDPLHRQIRRQPGISIGILIRGGRVTNEFDCVAGAAGLAGF
jgi:hypothetical protein